MMRAHSADSPARHKRQIGFFHTNDFFNRFTSGRKNYVYKTGVRCNKIRPHATPALIGHRYWGFVFVDDEFENLPTLRVLVFNLAP
jgi:hypothetical protein